MDAPKLHVSRWRLSAAEATGASDGAGQLHTSLRYLNEFVGQLQCAPALLQHGLFPDAKEITESMGLFNAVRRYVLPTSDVAGRVATEGDKPDGIVVVGDGNTPRSAAMFSFRLRNWKCFSIDPAMEMQSSERSRGWSTIENLVVIRNKIENVRISLRRAVIVLVHAHVTLEQALSAVDADEIAGVVTMPCCNWYSRQEQLFGRQPDLVYDDFSILSDHREIRLWAGEKRSEAVRIDHSDFSTNAKPLDTMKGCIRKEFVPDARDNATSTPIDSANSCTQHLRKKMTIDPAEFLVDMLRDSTGSDGESQKESSSEAVINASTSHIPKDSHVLVLETCKSLVWIHAMLQQGYNNLYTMSSRISEGIATENDLRLDLRKWCINNSDSSMASKCIATLCVKTTPSNGDGCQFDVRCSSVEGDSSLGQVRINYILDAGFLYKGFRTQPKNLHLLRSTCQLLEAIVTATNISNELVKASAATLISVTGSKTWRKKDSLGHPALSFQISTTVINGSTPSGSHSKPTFVLCCRKRTHQEPSDSSAAADQDPSISATRDKVLTLKRLLVSDFNSMAVKFSGEIGEKVYSASTAVAHMATQLSSAGDIETKYHLVASGRIARIRRFSHGMAFITLVDESAVLSGKQLHEGLQVFLQEETLRESSPSVSFADLVPLFRKGDVVKIIGVAKRNDRDREMLVAQAVHSGAGGEFEEF